MKIQTLPLDDPRYPRLLREIYDPPRVLYYAGNLEVLERPLCAVVGTRRMSGYGEAQAFRFARELSERGVCIVSGLAYGIDKAAHEGALMGSGGTIAVLAQGLPDVQPAKHRELAERILARGGLLLCEKPAGVETYKSDYLVRNRLIAGLCKGTVVVEAPHKSGAINTAKHVLDFGRELMALPGRVGEEVCEGTNRLVKECAHTVLQPKDVAEILGVPWTAVTVELDGLSAEIYAELRKGARSPAELGERFDKLAELYEALADLEMRGLIRFTKDLRYAVCSG